MLGGVSFSGEGPNYTEVLSLPRWGPGVGKKKREKGRESTLDQDSTTVTANKGKNGKCAICGP